MKRFIMLLILSSFLFAITACGTKDDAINPSYNQNENIPTQVITKP